MNFTDLLDRFRVPYHSSGKETRIGWVNFRCPFCQRDPYMGYNVSGRYTSCWNCGYHFLGMTLHALSSLPMGECWELVGELPKEGVPEDLLKYGKLTLPDGLCSLTDFHRKYIRGRGFNVESMVDLWGVQGIGQAGGMLRWRLFFPIRFRGEMVSWTTRTINPTKQPRYWSATDEQSAIPIRNLLYGADFVLNGVVVVEGVLDTWAIGPGAVALCGLRCSPAQLWQLSQYPVRGVCFDVEPEAQRRARQLVSDLSVFPGVTHLITLETGKDAASADKSEIESLRERFLK